MHNSWDRLAGRVPVNKTASRVTKRMTDQENGDSKPVADLVSENLLLSQRIIKDEAEMEFVIEGQGVCLQMLNGLLKYFNPTKKQLEEAWKDVELPKHGG